MFKHVLIPTDGSELSAKVAQQAAALAKMFGARITAVHMFPANLGVYYSEAVWVDEKMQTQMREAAQQQGDKYLAQVCAAAKAAQVACESVLLEGDSPWKGIVDTAEQKGCDLIMMAAHGRRGLAALVLGSETQRVLTHSKIPVLVYR